MLNLMRHCLPSLCNSLRSKSLIPPDIHEKALNRIIGSSERCVTLLDCIEAKLSVEPSAYTTIVHVLQSEPYLQVLAKQLVQNYCNLSSVLSDDSAPVLLSPAVSRYQSYLKTVYKSSLISRDAKWPPTPSNEYINLAIVKGGTCRDDYVGHVLKGNIKEALQNRKAISIEEILEWDQKELKLVLMEGAPGIGKSTLAWELCRKWEDGCPFMKRFSLVILLRLREEEVQRISSVGELFCSYVSKQKQALVEEVSEAQCGSILFILDGFDELPKTQQKQSFLLNLIRGHVLPESTVLVTSRPSATAELLMTCYPQKRIEVLGFTQESVKAYAANVFASQPEKLESFSAYISESKNPGINSLMYVPLNAAIIVQIFKESTTSGYLPHTLTEVYTQLCLTILNRYLKANYFSVVVDKFESLPSDLFQEFLKLSEIAFHGLTDEKTIFHTIDPNIVHFGFFDAVSALYGGKVSYNFLHLTLQEFFAACYISRLSDGGFKVFQQYGNDQRWNVVFRFVAGLTKFRSYYGIEDFFITKREDLGISVSLFLVQCLFEAQTAEFFDFQTAANTIILVHNFTFFDLYSLGYCIANYTNGVSWEVMVSASTFSRKDDINQSFMPGLQTNVPSAGVIKDLYICNHIAPNFASFKACSLQHLTALSLVGCSLRDANLVHFSEILSDMTNLWYLSIQLSQVRHASHRVGVTKLLRQLACSSVTSLDIHYSLLSCFLEDSPPNDWYVAFRDLVDPLSGKLDVLVAGERSDDGVFAKLLSTDSSLKTLYVIYDKTKALSHLGSNTSLKNLTVVRKELRQPYPLTEIIDILTNNKTLEYFCLGPCYIPDDIPHIRKIVDVLSKNSSLQKMELGIFEDNRVEQLTSDPRVIWTDVSLHPISISRHTHIFAYSSPDIAIIMPPLPVTSSLPI